MAAKAIHGYGREAGGSAQDTVSIFGKQAPISTRHSDSRGASIEYLRGEADIGRAPPEYQDTGAKLGAALYSGLAMRAEHAERILVKEAEAHRA